MERAKDYNGLLTILREATQAVGSAVSVLAERTDTESQAQFSRLREIRDELEFVGRDLAGGVIDLRAIHFDERAWSLLFSEPVIPLASEEPEPTPEPEPLPQPATQEQDDLFDFEGAPQDYGLGIPPDLLGDIDTSELDVDDTPTVPMLDV